MLLTDFGLLQVAVAAKVNKALEQKFLEVHYLHAHFDDDILLW